MRSLASLLTATIVAVWIVAIALISVQNATPVALRFLNFQLIEIPFGLVLAFSAGIGVLGTAIAQPLLDFSSPPDDD
ncbi:LapA family protein [Phormidesmis sp. 146-12]